MLIYFIITFIILIILLTYSYYPHKCNKDQLNFLNGYWISNDDFNSYANIDNMILYLDTDNTSNISIIINNKLICNNEVCCNIDTKTIKTSEPDNMYFKCTFETEDDEFIWDSLEFDGILSINNGNLKLFHDNILYADLFKDNIITSYINENNL